MSRKTLTSGSYLGFPAIPTKFGENFGEEYAIEIGVQRKVSLQSSECLALPAPDPSPGSFLKSRGETKARGEGEHFQQGKHGGGHPRGSFRELEPVRTVPRCKTFRKLTTLE